MIAVIGSPVEKMIVSSSGRLARNRKRDIGYAHSTAVTIVTIVAPPHRMSEFASGRNAVSAFQIAWKLPKLQFEGHATDREAAVPKEASTTHRSGTRKASPITSIATVLATAVPRARPPVEEVVGRVRVVVVIASPPPAAGAGTPARPRPRSGAAAAPRPCRSRAGRRRRPARTCTGAGSGSAG